MLPAHIAQNIRNQIYYYLQSTFSFRDKNVDKAFQRFIDDPQTGLFKGPWVMLKRPFRSAPENKAMPFDIQVPFHPFLHQYRAFIRLSSKNNTPQHTIVTTGTGSGKTECFLFPILDHCLRMKKKGKSGIKAQSALWGAPVYKGPDLKSLTIHSEEKNEALKKWELLLGEWLRHSVLSKRS